ncbi:MAG: hypothetical protein ABIR18_15525 [Chitinophagaceae bacterium]
MKKRELLTTGLIGLFIVSGLLSCKKNDANPRPDCKIVAIIAGANATAFTYNADGKLNSKNAATTDRLTYNGNIITITNSTGTTINTITTVTLNANGLASNAAVVNAAGTNLSNTAFEYNGKELSKSTITSASGGLPDITTYNWSGGNIVSFQNVSSITTFDYALDKPAQTGDFWNLQNLAQGFETIKTKNILKSFSTAATTTTINYDFDADGKITGLTGISGGAILLALTYQYECK